MVTADTSLQFNVLISNDGCPLLVDFGLSFIDKSPSSMDIEGSGGGTLNWMAPEQLESFECTPFATAQGDVWAFGMTALVCLRCPTFYLSLNVSEKGTLHTTTPLSRSQHIPTASRPHAKGLPRSPF